MNKLLAGLVPLAFCVALSGPALANSCPTHVQAIDAALAANPNSASPEDLAKAKELRDEGEKLHQEGKHAESMATLAEAEKLLGIGM
ncbi:MAG TPA: hypothetical protein VG742_17630 [Dongiaceae bacterium]|nr:hypothetical protein [Dongiaceae bacterium]